MNGYNGKGDGVREGESKVGDRRREMTEGHRRLEGLRDGDKESRDALFKAE